MASISKGVAIWRGRIGGSKSGHYGKTIIRGILSDAALVTFLGVIDALTSANLAKRSYNSVTTLQDTMPETLGDMDGKVVIVMKDTATDLPLRHSIPAPLDSIFEDTADGKRLTAANLTAYVNGLNTATGESYTGLEGYYWHRK